MPRVRPAGSLIDVNAGGFVIPHVSLMNGSPTSAAPVCPRCGKPMRFARSIPGIGSLPELWTFECRECAEATTEAKEPADDEAGAGETPDRQ